MKKMKNFACLLCVFLCVLQSAEAEEAAVIESANGSSITLQIERLVKRMSQKKRNRKNVFIVCELDVFYLQKCTCGIEWPLSNL